MGRMDVLVHRWRLTQEESLRRAETGSHTGTSWRETSANGKRRRSSPFGMPFGEDSTPLGTVRRGRRTFAFAARYVQ